MVINRIDILDSVLLRLGRIDRKIEFFFSNEEVRFFIDYVWYVYCVEFFMLVLFWYVLYNSFFFVSIRRIFFILYKIMWLMKG